MDPSDSEIEILRSVRDGTLDPAHVFGAVEKGDAPIYLICNSVPKSGTYLLLEIAKILGLADIRFHLWNDYIRRREDDRAVDHKRMIPAVLSTAALQPGMAVPAHLRYSFVLENSFLSRPEHRMLFIVRDPRDLVISRSDFVRSSAYVSNPWNAFLQQKRNRELTSDQASIASQIESHVTRGLTEFLPWLDSPACRTVRFESLYGELIGEGEETPALDSVTNYLGLEKRRDELRSVVGFSRTSSGRAKKIGVWRERMTPEHIERIKQPDFQKLVIQFGYDPTE